MFDREPEWFEIAEGDLEYCDCMGGKAVLCDWSRRVDPEIEVGKPDIPVNPLKKKNDDGEEDVGGTTRRKRSLRRRRDIVIEDDTYTDDIDDEVPEEFDYGTEPMEVNQDFSFPTESGITEEMARSLCLQSLRNVSSYETCSKVLEFDIEEPRALERCVDDIKVPHTSTFSFLNFSTITTHTTCSYML